MTVERCGVPAAVIPPQTFHLVVSCKANSATRFPSAPFLAAALAPTLEIWWASYWWTIVLLAILVGLCVALNASFGMPGLVAGLVASGITVALVALILYLSLWYWVQLIFYTLAAPIWDWLNYAFGGLF